MQPLQLSCKTGSDPNPLTETNNPLPIFTPYQTPTTSQPVESHASPIRVQFLLALLRSLPSNTSSNYAVSQPWSCHTVKKFSCLVHNIHNQIRTPSFPIKNKGIPTLPNIPNSKRKNNFPRKICIMHLNIGSCNK